MSKTKAINLFLASVVLMSTLTNKQIIGLLLALIIGLSLYFPEVLTMDSEGLHISALAFAAFLPAGCYQFSKLQWPLTMPVIIIISTTLAGLWYFILADIYPSSALIFSGVLFCGSYIILRIK